jgi:hypothetical protein
LLLFLSVREGLLLPERCALEAMPLLMFLGVTSVTITGYFSL